MKAGQRVAPSDEDAIPPDLIQAELERIIGSSAFDASRRNRAFLRFVVEEALAGRRDRIKAYAIGTGVLGRDQAFDPQSDPIVRIEASRLRRSLERYYLIAGQDDPVRIDVPKWGYAPTFRHLHLPPEGAAGPAAEAPAPELPQVVLPALPEPVEARTSMADASTVRASRRMLVRGAWRSVLVVGVALAVGIWGWHWAQRSDSPADDSGRGPSIIVLPFENLSDEPAKTYLAGGITEEILASLAQFREVFVYAKETGARYGPATTYEELHRALAVGYVLQGSVREAEGRVRVTARLVDVATGAQIWAAAYEEAGSGADLFRVQSDIAQRVVTEIAQPYGVIAVADTQRFRGKAPESLSAYECVLQVLDYYRRMSALRVDEARACLERATESEPAYADAWALLGMNYLDQVRLRTVKRSEDQDVLDRALQAAQRAAEVAPDSALAQRALLLVHAFRGEAEQASRAGERALALSPNNAEILAELGMRLAFVGEWERGISLIDDAIARNPAYPGWYHTAPALNLYRQGRYAEALEEAIQIDAPGWVHYYAILAMIYGELGQEKQAADAVRSILQMDPEFAQNAWYEIQLRGFEKLMAEHMVDGLRKAGLAIPLAPPSRSASTG